MLLVFLACVHPKSADSHPDSSVDSVAPDSDIGGESSSTGESDSESGSDSDTDSVTDSDSGDTGAAPPPVQDVSFVHIAASTFQMGCTASQYDCDPDDDTEHTVTLTHDFEIGITEVTRYQFMSRMGYDPTYDVSLMVDCPFDCPVDQVTWNVAARFTNVMSYESGLQQCYTCQPHSDGTCMEIDDIYECEGYRLPTEAEWESAARCGTDYIYAGSDNVDLVAWYIYNRGIGALAKPREVATREPNDCGTYDMSGNVAEWVNDWYGPYSEEAATDPLSTNGEYRSVRSGSYESDAYAAEVAFRDPWPQWAGAQNLGFRVARTLP